MALLEVSSDKGLARLQFTGCTLVAYSSYTVSRPLHSLIGLSVESVVCSEGASLDVYFSSGDRFSVSLLPEHYVGPEVFSAEFSDGTYIVA